MSTIKEIAKIATEVIQSKQEKEILYTPKYAVNILNRIINGEELNDKNLSENSILNDTRLNINMQFRWLGNKLLIHKANLCDCYMAVVDSIESGGKKANILGLCSSEKEWRDTKNNSYYQITICSEHLDRGVEDICSTLLHKMVHLYCSMNEIKDTSRSGKYHNKKFKQAAEAHGLIMNFDKKIGWSETELTEESKSFIRTFARKEFFSLRKTNSQKKKKTSDSSKEPKKPSSRKYVCPQCKCSVRATRDVNIICGDCNVKMEKV